MSEWIRAGALWLIGVDTPYGVHCCQGGCSSGLLDLTCDCEDNSSVREATLKRIKELHINPEHVEEQVRALWMETLENSPYEDRVFFETVLKKGRSQTPPLF
jgi:hypothetical protein